MAPHGEPGDGGSVESLDENLPQLFFALVRAGLRALQDIDDILPHAKHESLGAVGGRRRTKLSCSRRQKHRHQHQWLRYARTRTYHDVIHSFRATRSAKQLVTAPPIRDSATFGNDPRRVPAFLPPPPHTPPDSHGP